VINNGFSNSSKEYSQAEIPEPVTHFLQFPSDACFGSPLPASAHTPAAGDSNTTDELTETEHRYAESRKKKRKRSRWLVEEPVESVKGKGFPLLAPTL
jgi:hypothetical protein